MTDEHLVEIMKLLHSNWSNAVTHLEAVNAEQNDGSPDWDEFHVERVMNAKNQEDKWWEIRAAFKAEYGDRIARYF